MGEEDAGPVQKLVQLCTCTDLDTRWDVGINTVPVNQEPLFQQLNKLLAAEQHEAALSLYLQVRSVVACMQVPIRCIRSCFPPTAEKSRCSTAW